MDNNKPFSILVDIDALLDTRYGYLINRFPKIFDSFDFAINFINRLHDFIDLPDGTVLYEEYKNRTTDDLRSAVLTPLIYSLREFLDEYFKNATVGMFTKRAELVINIYPYQLSEEEQFELRKVIWINLGKIIDVTVTYKSLEELTPEYLKNNYSFLFYYDFMDWLDIHSLNGNLKTKACPGVRVHLPMRVRTKENIFSIIQKNKGMNPFEVLQELSLPIINIVFLNSEWFDLDVKRISKLVKWVKEYKNKKDEQDNEKVN